MVKDEFQDEERERLDYIQDLATGYGSYSYSLVERFEIESVLPEEIVRTPYYLVKYDEISKEELSNMLYRYIIGLELLEEGIVLYVSWRDKEAALEMAEEYEEKYGIDTVTIRPITKKEEELNV